jgi:predicted transcriptional regulator
MRVSSSKTENNRNHKGFNFFDKKAPIILLAILRGEFNIGGFGNKDLRKFFKLTASRISRLVKRLRIHGPIKKVGKSNKYYLTALGKETVITAQKLKEIVIIPAYCQI